MEMKQILLSHDSKYLYGLDTDGKIWVADVSMNSGFASGTGPAINVVWNRVRSPHEDFTPVRA